MLTSTTLLRLRDAGLRSCAVSYTDGEHPFGGGYLTPNKGLTERGKQFIRDCAELGIIVDLSHSGHQTARDVMGLVMAEYLEVPVMASHGGCYSVYSNFRNLPDDVLGEIAVLGGYMGINTMTFGNHATDDTPRPFLDHLAYALNRFGYDVVGIGADGVYQVQDLDDWKTTFYNKLQPRLDPKGELGSRWPDFPIELNTPERMPRIEDLLAEDPRFSLDNFPNVMGRNFRNFLQRASPRTSPAPSALYPLTAVHSLACWSAGVLFYAPFIN